MLILAYRVGVLIYSCYIAILLLVIAEEARLDRGLHDVDYSSDYWFSRSISCYCFLISPLFLSLAIFLNNSSASLFENMHVVDPFSKIAIGDFEDFSRVSMNSTLVRASVAFKRIRSRIHLSYT